MKESAVHPKVKAFILHPFAFAVFPIMSLYVKNVGKGFFGEAITIAIGAAVLTALLWLFASVLIKDRNKAAIIVSVFLVLFFTYGHAISASRTVLERVHLLDRARFLVEGELAQQIWLAVWAIVFLTASYFSLRLLRDPRLVTQFLNVVGLTLVVMVGVSFFTTGAFRVSLMPRIRRVLAHAYPGYIAAAENTTLLPLIARSPIDIDKVSERWWINTLTENADTESSAAPDIYYIILDMYVRADYLEEIYDYDNSDFLSFLTKKGFYVASKSTSNYPYTTHSLGSSLNLMYLDKLANELGEDYNNFSPSIALVQHSSLIEFLRNRGYTIVAFSTGYSFTEIEDADVFMERREWNPSEFQSGLMNSTALAILRKTQDDFHRKRVLYTLNHIADGSKIDSPTFVFAHVIAPHPPYVFGPNGEAVPSKPHDEYTYDEFKVVYSNQVASLNARMKIVIEEILSQSPEPPIIIVQADHGSCFTEYDHNIPERMSILNAYYFPGQDYGDLYESITPVNTFRVILNKYFDADYELLEDKNWFSSQDLPYAFTDVTDQVQAGLEGGTKGSTR